MFSSVFAALKLTSFHKKCSLATPPPWSQTEKYSLKIFIYNWRKRIICLSEFLAVTEAP